MEGETGRKGRWINARKAEKRSRVLKNKGWNKEAEETYVWLKWPRLLFLYLSLRTAVFVTLRIFVHRHLAISKDYCDEQIFSCLQGQAVTPTFPIRPTLVHLFAYYGPRW